MKVIPESHEVCTGNTLFTVYCITVGINYLTDFHPIKYISMASKVYPRAVNIPTDIHC